MSKLKYISAGIVLTFFAYCKTTKTASAPPVPFVPDEKQIAVVEKHWPNTPIDDIMHGQTIFVTKCTECHKAYEITRFSEKKWLHEIDDMSPKAKLTADEKLKLSKHILSYLEANSVVKAK